MDLGAVSNREAQGAASDAAKQRSRWILAIALSLALLAGATAFLRGAMLDPIVFQEWGYGTDATNGPKMADTWFTSDIPHVADLMTDRWSTNHYRSSRHPLQSLVLFPPVKAMMVVGVPERTAIWLMTAAVAAAWAGLLFFLLITWGCRILDAVVFTVLANVSAAAMFWLAVPEIFSYGSLTIVAALLLTMWPPRAPPVVRHAAALAASFSITVTNVVVGLVGALRARLSIKDLWIAGTSAFFVVTLVWAVGKTVLFPYNDFFLPPVNETFAARNSLAPTPGRLFLVLESMLATTVVMPRIDLSMTENIWTATVQTSMAWTGGVLGAIAALAWLGLLGLSAATARKSPAGLWWTAALSTGAMFVLHGVFGKETFLYAMHVLPLLIVMAAAVTFTRFRRIGLALAGVVILFGGFNNWTQYQRAVEITHEAEAWARSFPPVEPVEPVEPAAP